MNGLDRYVGLTGRTAIVTGASSGIGLTVAEAFNAADAQVVVPGNEPDQCVAVAQRLSANGPRAGGGGCDVRNKGALPDLVDRTQDMFVATDVLVCNAGVSLDNGSLGQVEEAAIDETFAVNLRHPLRLSGLVAPGMAERGSGSIVITSSRAGSHGNKAIGLYALTKAALMQLTRNIAIALRPSGVRANAIARGLIETGWTASILSDPTATARRLGMMPLRRVGRPFEIAAAALVLASSGGAFVMGQTIVVDGGTLITDGN